jgi:protein SCO1/2
MKKRVIQVAMSAILGVVVALVFTFREIIPDLGPGPGGQTVEPTLLPQPFLAPGLALTDPDGHRVELTALRGSVVAVFFGYTNCPDVCPITLSRLGRLQAALERQEPSLAVVFVSVDPDRDTPERLRTFVDGLPGRVLALSASEEEVRRQAADWGVMVRKRTDSALPEGDYLVDHTARTFILDPDGRVVATLPPMPSPAEVDRTMGEVLASLR